MEIETSNIAPILLITFNRPSHTRKVLMAIREQTPKTLYVFQDGPRADHLIDEQKIMEVRSVIRELVDWPCDLRTYYCSNNLGCGAGPATGISWFFENEEMGIVLEDDCLPHPDFFYYCSELLSRYANNCNVMLISSTLYNDKWKCDASYAFSHYMITGAWASWRRAWHGFDLDLNGLNCWELRRKCMSLLLDRAEADWWYFKAKEIKQDHGKKSYWDYQMQIHIFDTMGVTIHPQRNLVSNIGFDKEGTHTLCNNGEGNLPVFGILPLVHPSKIIIDSQMDHLAFAKRKSYGLINNLLFFVYNSMLMSTGFMHNLLMSYKRLKKII